MNSPKVSRREFIQYAVAGSTKDVLDPAQTNASFMINVGNQLGNNLTEIAPDGQLRSELAESWKSADAKTWAFKVRKGVEFHNGKTLDANDVVASFNHHCGEGSKSAAYSPSFLYSNQR